MRVGLICQNIGTGFVRHKETGVKVSRGQGVKGSRDQGKDYNDYRFKGEISFHKIVFCFWNNQILWKLFPAPRAFNPIPTPSANGRLTTANLIYSTITL
ncbi:MAG: hypothetical protein C0612_05900 [Desulfobulbaceae bacterium]|nr:MAG: hypothetical protein C0612_05900 [Desulfobulbaceae bacterium]